MPETLVEYIKRNLGKGYTIDTLRFALINQGYSRIAVDKAIENAQKELAEKAPKIKEKPIIKYEIYDADNKPIKINSKKSFWKRLFRK